MASVAKKPTKKSAKAAPKKPAKKAAKPVSGKPAKAATKPVAAKKPAAAKKAPVPPKKPAAPKAAAPKAEPKSKAPAAKAEPKAAKAVAPPEPKPAAKAAPVKPPAKPQPKAQPEVPKPKPKPKKSPFSPKDLVVIREQLLAQRAMLETEAADLNAGTFDSSQSELSGEVAFDEEYADAGTFTFERERDLSLGNNIRDLVDRIDIALTKIDRGTYGICERCGEAIPRERMKALPYSVLCVRCKQIEERQR